jgi:hypothetical protein
MTIKQNKDNYQIWIPTKEVVGIPNMDIDIQSFKHDIEGLRILVEFTNPHRGILRIKFPNHLTVRSTAANLLFLGIYMNDDVVGKTFYKVEDSSFLDWFNRLTDNLYAKSNTDLFHYAIYTDSDCIDIITDVDPIAEWI